MLEVKTPKEVRQHSINGIYALIGFDEYDLDDLLEPYGELVRVQPGNPPPEISGRSSEQ